MSEEDRMSALEGQLRRLRPAAVPEGLRARIGESVAPQRLSWSERFAAGFMGLSAAAVLTIAGLVVWQVGQPAPPSLAPMVAERRAPLPPELAWEREHMLAAR